MENLILYTEREGYATDQCRKTMTVGKLIEFLEDYDWSTKTTEQIKNPYYMSNHKDYDWYWKGN